MKSARKLKATVTFQLLLILIGFVSSRHAEAIANNGNASEYAPRPSSFGAVQPLLPSFAAAEVPQILKDILPGSGSSFTSPSGTTPSGFVEAGGALFFVADNGINGKELWRTDGTPAGTQMVKDIFPGPNSSSVFPHTLVEVAGLIYFAANDGTSGTELWRSDGTEAGTFRAKDIFPGAGSSNPRELVKLGDALLFNAEDGTTSQELWRSDGTEDGTLLLKDINPGFFGSSPQFLTSVGDTLCFFTASDETGRELWRSDGTSVGTFRAKDIFPFTSSSAVTPLSLIDVGGFLYFLGNDGAGYRLWRSDGSESGTHKVAEHVSPHPNDANFATMVDFGGTLIFVGQAPTSDPHGVELWRSDGTEAGTYMIKDISPGTAHSTPQDLFVFNGALCFRANDGTTGAELWKSDGTEAGTFRLKDILPGSTGSGPDLFVNVGGTLFFTAQDAFGIEIWRSDGTETRTVRVTDLLPSSAHASPLALTPLGTTLVFTANDGVHGREPWAFSINQAPSAADDSATTNEDTPVTVNIISNDVDPEGDILTVINVTQGSNGSVILNAGTVTYTPSVNFFGSDSFTYTVNDGHSTATATVNVTIAPVNDAPTAIDGAVALTEDTQIEIALLGSDIDSTSLSSILVSGPVNGTLSPIVNSKVIYTPDPNFSGSDCLTFIVNDGMVDSNIAAISIDVTPLPDPPVLATIGDRVITEGAPLSFTLSATDPDGEQLILIVSGLPEGATFDAATGAFSWTPNSEQAGTYSVTFTVTDPTGRSAAEVVTITVSDVVTNLGPICSAAQPSISEIWSPDQRLVPISIFGVTDPDNDPLTISISQILQDEPTNTFSDGNTSIDGYGVGTSQALIRAERSGARRVTGNGRVYEIFFEASDSRGKSCTGSVKVGVPHDQSHGPAVDDGKRYDSTVAGGQCLNCNP